MESLRNKRIIHLCINIEAYIGIQVRTPKDFVFLREKIFEHTHQLISTTTLKRLWGYLHEGTQARRSTLDLLSEFIGYQNWNDFCSHSTDFCGNSQEGGKSGKLLLNKNLESGKIIEISWMPASYLKLKYLGSDEFKVLSSINTRIVQGDTLNLYFIIEGEVLYIFDSKISGINYSTYFLGKVGGVRFHILD